METVKTIVNNKYHEVMGKYPIESALDHLNEYRYKPMPTPPYDVIKYAKEKIKDKDFEMKEGYWQKSYGAISWFNQIDKWRAINKGNYDWLKNLKKEFESTSAGIEIARLILEHENHKEWQLYGIDFLRELASFNINPPLEVTL